MPTEDLKKFGEELKDAREKAEVTLPHIASKTRIDIKFLRAIEEGNFIILPEVYIRAFIKEYAAHCNLDPNEAISNYDLAKSGRSTVKDISITPDAGTQKEVENSKKEFSEETTQTQAEISSSHNRNRIIIFASAAIALIIIILLYLLFIKDSQPEFVVEKPFEEVLEEQRQRFTIEENKAVASSTVSSDSLTLNFKADDTCWVNVIIDGKYDKEYMLYRNSSIFVKAAENFDIIVGNAGGITLELNGTPMEFLGRKGERKIFSVNKDGIINSSN
ncbi:transcriptional regulator [hydrocarbon metagenome]|uniref:Transcriptional regulator n=1 Tax=hydrocarbon metagenome TaxID=938273 RepID=A0A0W8FWQ5_9ZZZZ